MLARAAIALLLLSPAEAACRGPKCAKGELRTDSAPMANKSIFSHLSGIELTGRYQSVRTPTHAVCGSICDLHHTRCQAYGYTPSTSTCSLSSSYQQTGQDMRFHLVKETEGIFVKVAGKMDEKIEQKAGCVTKDQYDSFVEDAKMDWLKPGEGEKIEGETDKWIETTQGGGQDTSYGGHHEATKEYGLSTEKVTVDSEKGMQQTDGQLSTHQNVSPPSNDTVSVTPNPAVGGISTVSQDDSMNDDSSPSSLPHAAPSFLDTKTTAFTTTVVQGADGAGDISTGSESTQYTEASTTELKDEEFTDGRKGETTTLQQTTTTPNGVEISSSPTPVHVDEVTPSEQMEGSTPMIKEVCPGVEARIKSSPYSTYLRSDIDKYKVMMGSNTDEWANWCIEATSEGKVSMKNIVAGLYLQVDGSGLVMLGDVAQEWGEQVYSNGARVFKTAKTQFLMSSEEGAVAVVPSRSSDVIFYLETL